MISVVVPVFNVELFLSKCIESLIGQTYSDLEILLIDDGSTDSSLKICERYMDDSRVKILQKENGGVVSAVKKGIENAQGEFIGFVDADDFIDLDFYEKLMAAQKLHNADIVVSGHKEVNQNKKVAARQEDKNGFYSNKRLEDFKQELKLFDGSGLNYFCRWNKLYKTDLVKASLSFYQDGVQMRDDWLLNIPIFLNAKSIEFVKYEGYNYVVHANSLSRKENNGMEEIKNYLLVMHVMKNIAQSYSCLNSEVSKRIDETLLIACIKNLACKVKTFKKRIALYKQVKREFNYKKPFVLCRKNDRIILKLLSWPLFLIDLILRKN